MPSNMEALVSPIEEVVFVSLEDSIGTPKKPVSADAVFPNQNVDGGGQPMVYLPNNERRASFSRFDRIPGRPDAAEWGVPCYVKPNGDPGDTRIQGHNLLLGTFGVLTPVAATSDTYSLLPGVGVDLPALTIWHYRGHDVVMTTGAFVDQATFTIKAENDDDSLFGAEFGGMGMRQKRAGTALLDGTYAGTETTLALAEALASYRFQDECYVEVHNFTTGITDDNSGAGYLIDSVDHTANEVELATGLALANDATTDDIVVRPWKPAPVGSGDIMHGSLGETKWGTETINILQATIQIQNKIEIPNREQNRLLYPTRVARVEQRDVNGQISLYFTPSQSGRWQEHFLGVERALTMELKNDQASPADALFWTFGRAVLEAAEVDSSNIREMSFDWTALATSGDDEVTAALKAATF